MPVIRANSTDRHIGSRLRAARLEVGISQTAVGDVLDISFQQIQKYESGSNRIAAASLFELAAFFGKPIQWFFPNK